MPFSGIPFLGSRQQDCSESYLSSAPMNDDAGKRPSAAPIATGFEKRPMTKITDRDLVDRARSGDASAFGQLVRRHQQRIHRLAVHMLRDRAEAEDVTQETFIRAYKALT